MDEAEKVLERVDSLHLDFAKRAAVSGVTRWSGRFLDFDKLWISS